MITLNIDLDIYKHKRLDIQDWYHKIPRSYEFYEVIHGEDLKIDLAEFHKFFVVDVTATNPAIGQLIDNSLRMMPLSTDSRKELQEELSGLLKRKQIKKCSQSFTSMLLTIMLWSSYIDMPSHLEQLLLSCDVPSRYRVVSGDTLYRTLRLQNAVSSSNTVSLKPRKCSSWTTELEVAEEFLEEFGNVILKMPTSKADVIVNLGHEDFSQLNRYHSEYEVIVRGNGIDTVTTENIQESKAE